jgi:hypothetical protein
MAAKRPTPKIPGPEGFKNLPAKEKPAAAREWVQNTSSGDVSDDAAMYNALLSQYGIRSSSNPFRKPRGD